ncbi:MAG: alkaline phosphatase [Candidatus Tectimicrobiota bacterium]
MLAGSQLLLQTLGLQHAWAQQNVPAVLTPDGTRPTVPYGVASGDITQETAIIWSHTNRPSRMLVEYATTASFARAQQVQGPAALAVRNFTARVELTGLPAGQEIFYRVRFQDLADPQLLSAPVQGHFRTAPAQRRAITFVWGGDTAGQGWGINPAWGGMKIYEQMRRQQPDFFIHCGDYIYADGTLQAEVTLDDGSLWHNVLIPEKTKVAETLEEFRGNYIYNLLDDHVRRFNAEVPQIVQWDDHETTNNWFPGGMIEASQPRAQHYSIRSYDLLAAYAKQAFCEYTPIRLSAQDPERLYRALHYGPALDLFMLDERSYRGPNSANRQEQASPATAFLGTAQMQWLKRTLLQSRATWKVISSDMPLGLQVDDTHGCEAWANGDGPALGRELELAELLRFIKHNAIHNVVWITADVHYAAAHFYDPAQAQFTDFQPFWEFVAGPLHAGTFGPNRLDNTFGPQVKFLSVPPDLKPNRSPAEGLQFFGRVQIQGPDDLMTVSLHDLHGATIYRVELSPQS